MLLIAGKLDIWVFCIMLNTQETQNLLSLSHTHTHTHTHTLHNHSEDMNLCVHVRVGVCVRALSQFECLRAEEGETDVGFRKRKARTAR